jgi:hypothetical protein
MTPDGFLMRLPVRYSAGAAAFFLKLIELG